MGSGTTAKIAQQMNRNWIGSEISQDYVNIAEQRLELLNKQSLFHNNLNLQEIEK